MPEYVVDCKHVPYGDGKKLVLPVSISASPDAVTVRTASRRCGHRLTLGLSAGLGPTSGISPSLRASAT